MSGKKKLKGIELDDFSYHEVVHTLNLMLGLIDASLIQHPVLKLEKEVRQEVEKATDHLFEAYQKIAQKY
tara:strand:+ start:5062 stop:5271 length:210 start_codon:yes stop_codon:yes gene_type:complete